MFRRLPPGATGLRFLLGFSLAAALASCATSKQEAPSSLWQPSGNVKRQEAISIANAYVQHRWKPTKAHVYHGKDGQGVRVDTPDVHFSAEDGVFGWWQPGQMNTGLPYKWGGFDTPDQFDDALKRGLRAGDVYSPEKRELNNAAVSAMCAGIDCSGFISRCWRLSAPFSTYEIAKICEPLTDFGELKPGDVVNKESEHIFLFAGVADKDPDKIVVYDVGCPPHWKAVRHTTAVAWLKEHGYKPWRYRGMVD